MHTGDGAGKLSGHSGDLAHQIRQMLKWPLKAAAQYVLERAFFGLDHPYRLAGLMRRFIGTHTSAYRNIRGFFDPACYPERTMKQYFAKWHDSEGRRLIDTRLEVVASGLRAEGVEPRTCLEVGCGPGWNLGYFRRVYPKAYFVGLDYSDEQLQGARKLGFHDQGIAFLQGDMHRLPFADHSFDVVCTFMVVVHVAPSKIEHVLQELLRVSSRYIVHMEPTWDYIPKTVAALALLDRHAYFHNLCKMYLKRFRCRVVAETYSARAQGPAGWHPVFLLVEKSPVKALTPVA